MAGWSGTPHSWDKAAVPWRQTIFLPRGSVGIERLLGMNVKMLPVMVEQQPRQLELSGDYDLELEYTSAAAAGVQRCNMRLPFRVGLPSWWREQQAEKLRVDAVSTEAEVLSPQILEFRARLLVQMPKPEVDSYRPDPAARELLREYQAVINAPAEEEVFAAAEIPTDLAELKAAALGRLQGLRKPEERPIAVEIAGNGEEEVITGEVQKQMLTEEIAVVAADDIEAEADSAEEPMSVETMAEALPEDGQDVETAMEAASEGDSAETVETEMPVLEYVRKPVTVSRPEKKEISVPVAPPPLPDDGTAYRLCFVRGDGGWQQL